MSLRDTAIVHFSMGHGQHAPDLGYGSEVIDDGDMEAAGTSEWSAWNNAILTKETGAAPEGGGVQILRVAYDDTSNPKAYQTDLVASTVYEIEGWARGDGTAAPAVAVNFVDEWSGTTSTDWQYFRFVVTAGGTELALRAVTTSSSYAEFAWVEVREVSDRTLNVGKGGSAYDATFPAGAAIPTKLPTQKGYSFDGGDYMVTGDVPQPSGDVTVFMTFMIDHNEDGILVYLGTHANVSGVNWHFLKSAGNILRFYVGSNGIGQSAQYTFREFGQRCTLVGVWDGTDTKLYFNGVWRDDAGTPLAPDEETCPIVLCATYLFSSKMAGEVYDFGVIHGEAWGSSEVMEYHQLMMRSR
jgi:hypothetical protein